MSKYPDMKRPPVLPPVLTGDCKRDVELGTEWMRPEAVEARAELWLQWEEELAERAHEAERLAQEQLAEAWAELLAQEQLAEAWVLAAGLAAPTLEVVASA